MTTVSPTTDSPAAIRLRGGLGQAVRDTMTMTWRNVRGGLRVPDNLLYMFIQPIMFVLLFAYVFGGAIPIPGAEGDPDAYRKYLMAGIFVQTMAFSVAPASVGMADDMDKGLIDRFRSLPMARSAVIAGAVFSVLINQIIVLAIMVGCGFLVGWDVPNGIGGFLAACGLLILFAFAMLWIGSLIGLSAGNPQVAASAGLIWLFPVIFLSNAFIPTETLPSWLQPVADWNPISAFVAASRELFGNPNPFVSDAFPMEQPVIASLIWVAVIVAIFAPLAVRKYKSATTK